MGWYGSSESGNANSNGRTNQNRQTNNAGRGRGGGNYLPNPRIEKIIEGKYTGEGVKWTPSYAWKVNVEALQQFRIEFWNTRTQGNADIWNVLRNAIAADPADAEAIIKATGLNAHAGIMTLIFDEHKFPYRIPIAWINDPIEFLPNEAARLDFIEKPKEELFEGMKIRSIGEDDYEFNTSNYTLISELKVQFLDEINLSDHDLDKWVFLFSGKKIDDQLPLYSIFNLQTGYVLQCMIIDKP